MKRRCCVLLIVALISVGSAAYAGTVDFLPMGRSLVGKADLPLPIGIWITYYGQKQDYAIDKLKVSGMAVPVKGMEVTNYSSEVNIEVDVWLLPFLNVFGLVGKVNSTTGVDGVQLMGQDLSIDYDLDGVVYGGGTTLAYGCEHFFASITGTYTSTKLDDGDSSVNVWLVSPKLGYNAGPVKFWIGANYQRAEEKHSGSYTVPYMGSLEYEVKFHEKNPWSFLVGTEAEITPHWRLIFEGGLGEHREQVQLSLAFRI